MLVLVDAAVAVAVAVADCRDGKCVFFAAAAFAGAAAVMEWF